MYYFEKCEKKRTTIGQLVLLVIYGHKHDNEIKLRTVPTFLLRIRSAHLEILGLPMGGAY